MARTRSGTQKIREIPGGTYGDRKQLTDQQSAAPLAGPTPSSQAALVPAGPPPRAPNAPDVFGPTTRPGEPITSGVPIGPGDPGRSRMLPPDPVAMLRALYVRYPNDDLRRLLERAAARQARR